MANSFSASFPKYWSRRMQRQHHKTDVFRAFASFEERSNLTKGNAVERPYRSKPYVQTYTRGTDVTIQDQTDTGETLTVNQSKVVPIYVDKLDEIQHNYKVRNEYADDSAIVLGNYIDGDVLGEYDQAASSVDDGDIGGTAGNAIDLTTGNIRRIFTIAKRKLRRQNARLDNLFAVISPEFEEVLLDHLAGRESLQGDNIGMNGRIGMFMGFELMVSNSTGWSGQLAMATNPTADDTVTVAGVTWTFKASPSAAGEIDIAGSADATRALLADAINNADGNAAGAGSATTYYEVSAANRALLVGIVATNDDTNNVLDIKAEGHGFVTVSETLTAAADVWTTTKQSQHCLFGRKGAIDVVIQAEPQLEIKEEPKKLGVNLLTWTLYGLKTFNEGTKDLVDVPIKSDNFS